MRERFPGASEKRQERHEAEKRKRRLTLRDSACDGPSAQSHGRQAQAYDLQRARLHAFPIR